MIAVVQNLETPQMDPETTADLALAERVVGGDESALAVLYERHADPLFAFVCHHLDGARPDEHADADEHGQWPAGGEPGLWPPRHRSRPGGAGGTWQDMSRVSPQARDQSYGARICWAGSAPDGGRGQDQGVVLAKDFRVLTGSH